MAELFAERDRALKAWKKQKPLLLQDTGVSEILRKLPADLTNGPISAKDLLAVAKKVEDKSKEKAIKADKKTAAFLVELKNVIEREAAQITKTRDAYAKNLTEILAISAAYYKALKEGVTLKLVNSYDISKQQKTGGILMGHGRDTSAVSSEIDHEATETIERMTRCQNRILEVLADAAKKPPKLDTKAEFVKARDEFGKHTASLSGTIKKVNSLD